MSCLLTVVGGELRIGYNDSLASVSLPMLDDASAITISNNFPVSVSRGCHRGWAERNGMGRGVHLAEQSRWLLAD